METQDVIYRLEEKLNQYCVSNDYLFVENESNDFDLEDSIELQFFPTWEISAAMECDSDIPLEESDLEALDFVAIGFLPSMRSKLSEDECGTIEDMNEKLIDRYLSRITQSDIESLKNDLTIHYSVDVSGLLCTQVDQLQMKMKCEENELMKILDKIYQETFKF